jgi:hypothetical protein
MNCRYIAQTTAFFKSAVSHGDAQRNFSRKMWSTWLQLSIRRDNVFTCYEKNDPHESNNKRIVEKKKQDKGNYQCGATIYIKYTKLCIKVI